MEILLLGKNNFEDFLFLKCMFLTIFVHKDRKITSNEWEKKNLKNHPVFTDHPSNIRTTLSQMDENLHIQVY